MCRQFIREFCAVSTTTSLNIQDLLISVQLNTPILMYDKDARSTVLTLEQLLPMSFGPENLTSTDELAMHNS